MIGNLILIADVVSRSHSINILVLFFIIEMDVNAIKMAINHITMLLYLAIGICELEGLSVLFVSIDVIIKCLNSGINNVENWFWFVV